jgi:S1-C subfamily serine protease
MLPPFASFSVTLRWRALAACLLILVLLVSPEAKAQELEPEALTGARQASVFVMQTYEVSGVQALSCVGSGTLVDPTGLILTNAHLAQAEGPCVGERIVIALPVRLDEPPVPTYLAEPIQIDNQLDLAILQIVGSLDGSPLDPDSLNLPFVEIGDPSQLTAGNTLRFIGYPNIGSTSGEVVEGPVTGITTETGGSRMAWLRTDAPLNGTMSGGGAYDPNGRLVGVPTGTSQSSDPLPGESCLNIQDVTGDGLIDERDACVPVGESVSTIRPISFALPMIQSAQNGFHLAHKLGLASLPSADSPVISRVYLSTQVDDFGVPTQIRSSFPSGTTSLFVFFDYDNMRPGLPYEIRVSSNSIDIPLFSLGPLSWGNDQKGTWYVGTENITWPDGTYEFTVFVDGTAAASTTAVVGGTAPEPTFSNLRFGLPDGSGGLAVTGKMFPAEVTQIDAKFQFENMLEGQDWTEAWYLDEAEVFRVTRIWDRESGGETTVNAINLEGLPLGTYRLDLFIGERLAATGDVILAGNSNSQSQSAIFSNDRMSNDISRDGLPAGTTGEVMPLGVSSLYTFVDWDFLPNGLSWTYRWFLDGSLVATSSQNWDAGGVGKDFWMSLQSDSPLPEGVYAVEVLVENQPMFSKTVSVGSGTRPTSGTEAEGDEVMITGTVVNALTQEGIPGALVAVLDVALESPDFTWDESEIFTQAITDRQGQFSFPRGLPRGNFYTVYVFAEGFITIIEDNFTILSEQPSPTDIVIEMTPP